MRTRVFVIIVFLAFFAFSCGRSVPQNDIFAEYLYFQRTNDTINTVINEDIQRDIGLMMKNHKVPYGVILVSDARNGRILAVDEYSTRGYEKGKYINKPLVAASIFKIVSLATAIGTGIFNPKDKIEYYDRPYSELTRYMEKRKYTKYGVTTTVENALALSNNSAFAEIGLKLNGKKLSEYANKFLFNKKMIRGINTGYIDNPENQTEMIKLCSGLKHSYMSPFHALLIAMSIANNGTLVIPYINKNDKKESITVVGKNTANGILDAMSSTTISGTSKRTFSKNTDIAKNTYAKTGSLIGTNPDGYYNWFLGVYDGKKSRYAIVVLTVNDPKWSVKANYLGYKTIEFIRKYEEN